MSSITLRDIRKSYGKATRAAVEKLTLEIPKSEFLCLLGPSGCGKTTTLRMIAGLEFPTEGQILVDGKKIVSVDDGIYVPPEKRGMGLVFQNYALWPHMTVVENVEFGLKLHKVAKPERDQIVNDVLQKLGIERYRDRLPAQMSGGQQQRVALARMLALKPEIILLDEPLSNLDAKLRLEMRAELKRIHQEMGSTVVFVTHDQWEAMTLATTIAVMSEGELQQLGTPDDIYERPANRFVAEFIGNLPINITELNDTNKGALANWTRSLLAAQKIDAAKVGSVGIRPESVRISAQAVEGACAAKIVDIVPTGGSWIVELAVQDEQYFAIISDAPAQKAGEEIWITVEANHIHVFDGGGKRISG
ncbi:iron(III) transport system ATP-binding protein [Paenochrobactrum gallinarii]|uniref:Iron(III) transport system ATP-binding protein n=1 Tax=Paenochrobactrum gallinarii TaxID=643673 RepID=A0A841M3T6_9HYPH|nr:ABC transporter ATP-binding protein [Paenochrobactrum gallinarii]MBB6260981.1 iron(III) transport system ATP-binding protein [Paenochrobactrum gallinarii]